MIRQERYLVTTTVGERSRKRVWDASRPIGIGFPFRWILERTDDGVRVRSLGGATGEEAGHGATAHAAQIRIAEDRLQQGETVQLPASITGTNAMSMHIQPVRRIHAPYMVRDNGKSDLVAGMPFQLFAYSGIQRSMVECDQVHGAYVAYFRGKPVFTAYKKGDGLQIKPLLSGIFIKVKGGPAVPAYPNETLELAAHKVPLATVVRGSYWWKFNFVRLPEPPSAAEIAEEESETRWFAGFLTLFGALFLLLIGSVIGLFPTQVDELNKPLEDLIKKPPIVVIHRAVHKLRTKSIPDAQKGARTQQAGSEGTPAKAVQKKVAKKTPEPAPILTMTQAPKAKKAKPVAAPMAVHKVVDLTKKPPKIVKRHLDKNEPGMKVQHAEVKKVARIQAPPAPPQPNPAEIAAKRSAAALSKQAAFLQEAVSGAKNLAAKDDMMSTASDDPNGAGTAALGQSMAGNFSPTEVRAKYSGSGRGIDTIGGGADGDPSADSGGGRGHGSGVGYGKGKHANVAGQGDGLVSVDSGAAEVAEGLTKEEVGAVIHSHMTEIRYCHEQSLLGNPTAQGKIVLDFTINAAGRVEAAAQGSSNYTEGSLASCLIRRLRTWKFPNPVGGVKVTIGYPFVFRTLRGGE